jgi:peptide chain release factor subunit 1
MQQFNFLTKLLDFEPTGSPLFSIYLNTEPNGTGKRDFDIFLKKQISEHEGIIDPTSAEKQHFDAVARRINDFVEGIDPSTRSVAIFASSGEDGFFETFQFQVPIDENEFFSFDKPHIYPLVRLMDQHPTFAVVAADTNSAFIYTFKRGRVLRKEEIEGTKTNRSEVGGWSQMRFQRHIDNFHQQHAKEVVEELSTVVRNDRIDAVVLVGDKTVIIPMLCDEMKKEVKETVVATLSMNVNTPEHELLEAADRAVRDADAEADKEKVDFLFEHNYDDGVGVAGVEKTLAALFSGQVQELYLTADLDEITYDRNAVRTVLASYAPGEDGELPDATERAMLIDELIKQAARSADRIRFIEDPHLLKTVGGVGAILRYQAKGVSNI